MLELKVKKQHYTEDYKKVCEQIEEFQVRLNNLKYKNTVSPNSNILKELNFCNNMITALNYNKNIFPIKECLKEFCKEHWKDFINKVLEIDIQIEHNENFVYYQVHKIDVILEENRQINMEFNRQSLFTTFDRDLITINFEE